MSDFDDEIARGEEIDAAVEEVREEVRQENLALKQEVEAATERAEAFKKAAGVNATVAVTLGERISALEVALKPFVEALGHYGPDIDANQTLDFGGKLRNWNSITVGDLRNAKKTLDGAAK